MSARTIEIGVNGKTLTVSVERVGSEGDRYRVSWDGVSRLVDARQVDAATLSLVTVEGGSDSHLVRWTSTDRQGELDVHVAGGIVRTFVDTGHGFASGSGPGGVTDGEQAVTAPMPGKVIRVLVEPGDEVDARQGVVVIEAMKMENELRSPRAGRVKEVAVEVGASVDTGRVLVVIA